MFHTDRWGSDDGRTWDMPQGQPEIPEATIKKLQALLRPGQVRAILTVPIADSPRELARDACAMSKVGIPEAEQELVLRCRYYNYHRPLLDREFARAILFGQRVARGEVTPGPKYQEKNDAAIRRVIAETPRALEVLRARSPEKSPDQVPTGAIISRLFAPDSLLCFAGADKRAVTDSREVFAGHEHEFPFIVPNAMSAMEGTTTDGRPSVRSLSNVGPRQHVVVEHDFGTRDEQAAILLNLSKYARLRLVVFSGSKSLHGWFDVRSRTEDEVAKFLNYAAYLGADTATFSRIQLVRNPNAMRDETRKQTVEYLEASPASTVSTPSIPTPV